MEVEIAALIRRTAEENKQINSMMATMGAAKGDVKQLRVEAAEQKRTFEAAMQQYDDGHARMQREGQEMEQQLMAATEGLTELNKDRLESEARIDSLREEINRTARDLQLLNSGQMLTAEKERLAQEAGLDLSDTNLREGPPKMPPPPLTPRAIKDKVYSPSVGFYQPQLWGGDKPVVRAVFGGSLGKFDPRVISQPPGTCELSDTPHEVNLNYGPVLRLGATLLEHHFRLNKPFSDAVRREEIARRFGFAFGSLALSRVLFMNYAEFAPKDVPTSHWLHQIKHLEHLNVECPEPILRLVQHVGHLTHGGRIFIPQACERQAGEAAVQAFVALTGLDEEGGLLPEDVVQGIWQVLSVAPFDSDSGCFSAMHPAQLIDVWDAVATRLSEQSEQVVMRDYGGVSARYFLKIQAEHMPLPQDGDTAGSWFARHRAFLQDFQIDCSAVEEALSATDPLTSIPPAAVHEYNRLCDLMEPFTDDPEEGDGPDEGYRLPPDCAGAPVQDDKRPKKRRLPVRACLRVAVEQLSRFMLTNKVYLRRTLSTGSFSSLGAAGSIAQFVYKAAGREWVSGIQQSAESAVMGALLGLGGQATPSPHFVLKVGDLKKRKQALLKTSERERQ